VGAVNSPIIVTPAVTNTICTASLGAINITVSNGTLPYTYLWSNGAITEDISGLPAGTYNVTVTDANGCSTSSTSIVATVNSPITVTPAVTNTICTASLGVINITVSNGTAPYTYLWSNGAITEDISGLPAGTYTVTVTDANGCSTSSTSIVATVNSPITVTPSVTNTICTASLGAINITVSNGTAPYTYLWSNGAITEDISGLPAGTYTVTVTDANGCSTSSTSTIDAISVPYYSNAFRYQYNLYFCYRCY
jgi:muramidase (phage lysozyme)